MKNNEIAKAIKHLSLNDKIIFRLIKKYENCNIKPRRFYFKQLLKIIINQQLSQRSADAIIKRFLTAFPDPSPADILKADHNELHSLGLSKAKAVYVKDLSEKLINKNISLTGFKTKTDNEIIDELTKVKGIGIWSSHIFLMFILGRLNILPYGDLGIKRAIMLNYKLNFLPYETFIKNLSLKKNWQPYNSVACWYLWKSLEGLG